MQQIIKHFSQQHQVFVLTWRYSSSLPAEENLFGAKIFRVDAKNLYDFYLKWRKFTKNLVSEIDLIHSNTYFSAFIWDYLSKKYKKPHFAHVHWAFWRLWDQMVDWKFQFLKSLKFKLLEKKIFSMKANFICVSKYVYDILKFTYWVEDDRLHLVYNGLDIKSFKYDTNEVEKIKKKINPTNDFVYLFYGRKEKVKNVGMLINAFKKLNLPKTKLILILTDFWKDVVKQQLASNIEIYSWIEHKNLPNWIKAANVVVFPSLVESFGYVGLETSLLNVPLVASNMGAIPEIVFWKVRFFNPFDENDLIKALKDAKNWNFEIIPAKNFDLCHTLVGLEKLYYEVWKGRGLKRERSEEGLKRSEEIML